LPIGAAGPTALAAVVRTLLAAGLPEIAVVAGAHVEAVREAMPAQEPRARVVVHPGWANGQLSSLLAGLDALIDERLEGLMVTLVDVPLVSAATVTAVVHAWRQHRAPITRPVQSGRHGHPVVFDRAVFDDLRRADPAIGAKAVFASHRVFDVEVLDEGAFVDLDTPDDYRRVIGKPAESPGRESA